MHSKEFKKIYHPKLGRYVYEHRGNGLIVDHLFKPLRRKANEIGKKVVQPFLKAKAKEGLSKTGEKLGKKAVQMTSERAGDLIRARLNGSSKGRQGRKANVKGRSQEAQDVNTLINNLIAMS